MHNPGSSPRPGRPVDPDKIERILDHALQSIAEGDLQFGMESVARRAGVAKSTLYRHFDNAEGLLKAVLERQHRALVGHGPEPFSSLEGLREQLLRLGHQLLAFLASEEGVKILRAVIAHGARHGARCVRQECAIADCFLIDVDLIGDDWRPGCHRFDDRQAEALVGAG